MAETKAPVTEEEKEMSLHFQAALDKAIADGGSKLDISPEEVIVLRVAPGCARRKYINKCS